MTDEQIVKALEYCLSTNSCEECPICNTDNCGFVLMRNAFDLITRQQAEIERFADIGKMYSEVRAEAARDIATEYEAYKEAVEVALVETRTEAIKEFAERLKERKQVEHYKINGFSYQYESVEINDIDNLVREMTEEKK